MRLLSSPIRWPRDSGKQRQWVGLCAVGHGWRHWLWGICWQLRLQGWQQSGGSSQAEGQGAASEQQLLLLLLLLEQVLLLAQELCALFLRMHGAGLSCAETWRKDLQLEHLCGLEHSQIGCQLASAQMHILAARAIAAVAPHVQVLAQLQAAARCEGELQRSVAGSECLNLTSFWRGGVSGTGLSSCVPCAKRHLQQAQLSSTAQAKQARTRSRGPACRRTCRRRAPAPARSCTARSASEACVSCLLGAQAALPEAHLEERLAHVDAAFPAALPPLGATRARAAIG